MKLNTRILCYNMRSTTIQQTLRSSPPRTARGIDDALVSVVYRYVDCGADDCGTYQELEQQGTGRNGNVPSESCGR